jgi:hypothetical protein
MEMSTLNETDVRPAPLADPLAEAERVLDAAAAAGLALRAVGGVAIALIAPSARQAPLAREYNDIDFVARSGDARAVAELFTGLGYAAEEEFNVLHGQHRLFFHDAEHHRDADVFLDAIEMCHNLDLRDRLEVTPRSLPPADLLLSKLQVVETNQKDYTDTIALLSDFGLGESETDEVGMERVAELCAADWGWWKTVTTVAGRTVEFSELWERNHGGDHSVARARLTELVERLEAMPKSRRWKMRARVGERVRWYEEPEDVEHDSGSAA